jgi:uncharacterized phiE125 gp8 family phage protein
VTQIELVSPPEFEPLSIVEAKQHLRIDDSDHDADVAMVIPAARERAEEFCNRSFARQVRLLRADGFTEQVNGHDKPLRLLMGPVVLVNSVKYDDVDGNEQTLSTSVYTVAGGYLMPKRYQSWPALSGYPGCVRIEYITGFGPATGEPDYSGLNPSVIAAIKLFLGDLYEQREESIVGTIYTTNPTAERLLWPFRTEFGL